MKIIHVIANMEIGGAQRLLADLLPIQSEKYEVALLMMKPVTNRFTNQLKEAGVKLLTINARHYYSPFNVFSLLKETEGKMPNPRMEDVYKTLSKERRDLTESMFPDDEEYAVKTRRDGIVYRVIYYQFAVGADRLKLLDAAAVARTYACCHDEKCGLHWSFLLLNNETKVNMSTAAAKLPMKGLPKS